MSEEKEEVVHGKHESAVPEEVEKITLPKIVDEKGKTVVYGWKGAAKDAPLPGADLKPQPRH